MRGGGVSVTTTSGGVLGSSISGGSSLTAAHHRRSARRATRLFGSRLPNLAARTFRWQSVGRVRNVYVLPDQRLVECRPSESILRAGLRAGVPFAHACGGNGKCSTCRVVVVEGHQSCSQRTPREQAIADRLGFGPQFRLACQTSVRGEVTVRRLVLDERDVELADVRRRPRSRRRQLRAHFARRGGHQRPRSIGDEMPVTIMFADIRGFTAFVETVLPYDVIHVLQRVLGDVTASIERHGGAVTSYMGDGVMALFGDDGGRTSSRRAVRAGLEILANSDNRRAALEELYGRSFDLNVGIHFGTAIVGGLLGDAVTLTAIGDTVNMANRIEQANKEFGTRFLVSDSARAELDDGVQLGRSFVCQLPGKAGEYELFEVLGLDPDRSQG
jgi:adenylate cyclase